MTMAVILALVIAVLAALLAVLLRSLDLRELRDHPMGLLSMAGLWAAVGGGFLLGMAYGFVIGYADGSVTWEWAARGVVDGLVVACAGAAYIAYQQRRHGRGGRGPDDDRRRDHDRGPSGDDRHRAGRRDGRE